eukprot:754957-Hanusia_phi.AAC.3
MQSARKSLLQADSFPPTIQEEKQQSDVKQAEETNAGSSKPTSEQMWTNVLVSDVSPGPSCRRS